MKVEDYQKLLELVCNRQDYLLTHGLWDGKEYKHMERLKVKLKKKTKKKGGEYNYERSINVTIGYDDRFRRWDRNVCIDFALL